MYEQYQCVRVYSELNHIKVILGAFIASLKLSDPLFTNQGNSD